MLKEWIPPVKPGASGGQHPEDHYHVPSGRIPGDGPFHHHQLILSEWCLYLEKYSELYSSGK